MRKCVNRKQVIFCQLMWLNMNNKILCCCYCLVAKSYLTLSNPMDCSTPDLAHLHYLLKCAQKHVLQVSDTIQPSHLLQPSSPAFNLSQYQGLSQRVDSLHTWPKYWRFSFRISPSDEYSGLISFRLDWFDLLAVQGTLKNLL